MEKIANGLSVNVGELIAAIDIVKLGLGITRMLAILILGLIAYKLLMVFCAKLQSRLTKNEASEKSAIGDNEAKKRAETLTNLLRSGIKIILFVIVTLTLLKEVGIDIAPLIASAGIVGLAVGFGAQNLVKDVISGFFILLENQVRAGDVAIVNGTGGLVERVNFRTIVLRDLSGVVHVFPNGSINSMSNMTKEWSAYVVEIGVAYKEDTDRVISVMKDVFEELRQDSEYQSVIIDDIEIFGVDSFGDSAVMIKGRIKTAPIEQWRVGRGYLARIKKAFDREGIEIPFPHRSLYLGEASKPFLAKTKD